MPTSASPAARSGPPRDSLPWLLRVVPALGSLRGYTLHTFRRDLFAGLTVAAVAVPQAMAYASIFGMPPKYGLYTAILMTAVGALLSSSKQLINGPTNAISIAMLSALAVVPQDERISAAILMATLIGLIQTGITLLRLGDLSRYISHAVIVGFTAGASVLLVLDQMKHVLGLEARGDHHDHFLKRFYLTITEGGEPHFLTLWVALGTIATAVALRWLNRRLQIGLPELLLAIAAAGYATYHWELDQQGVELIDKVPRNLPSFQLPAWEWNRVRELSGSAVAIAMLGLLEAIAMSKSISHQTKQKVDINQLCLSEGVANLTGSFFQCFPGSGSLTRSYINHHAGAVTQWAGVISAVAVALIMLALAPLAQYIPRAALAGVLLLAATRMIDLAGIRYHFRATKFDAVIVTATALSAVFVSIEFCILVGTVLSFLIYVPKAAKVTMEDLVIDPRGMVRERYDGDVLCDRIKMVNFEGELFFGSSPEFESQLEGIEESLQPTTQVVLVRVKHLRNPDAVCMHLLCEFINRIELRGIKLCLAGVRDDFFQILNQVGIVDQLGTGRVFREAPQVWSSTTTALNWAHEQLEGDYCATCPRRHADAVGVWDFEI